MSRSKFPPKAVDLFAGAGGMSLGFRQSGFNVVMASECDPAAAEAYRENIPDVELLTGSVADINLADALARYAGRITVVCGRPPWQGITLRGRSISANDRHNANFRFFLRAVDMLRPMYFVMLCVRNVLDSGSSSFGNSIADLFAGMGYRLSAGFLNAVDFGVPQHRKMFVTIGRLGGQAPALPAPCGRKVTVQEAISDLAFLEQGRGRPVQEYRFPPQSEYQAMMREGSAALYSHVASRHSQAVMDRLSGMHCDERGELITETDADACHRVPASEDDDFCRSTRADRAVDAAGQASLQEKDRTSHPASTWLRLKADEPAPALPSRFDKTSSRMLAHPTLDRTITVREAARLQSFPDTFHFCGTKNDQMRQAASAVPPLLAKAVAETIMQDMSQR